MKYTLLAPSALLCAAVLSLASCTSENSGTSPEEAVRKTQTREVKKGVPGGIVVETYKITATVTAIDKGTRSVTLSAADGTRRTFSCGPEVVNFDQIKVGDQLKAIVTDELAVSMATPAEPSGEGAAELVALAPKGAKPGGVVVGTVQVTATVTAIYPDQRKATLQFSDGSVRTVAVRDDVDLSKRKVGEQVIIRATQAIALSVETP